MAEKQERLRQDGVKLDCDQFCCSVCLDLFEEPVTIYCGHSYCWRCIEDYWGEKGKTSRYDCPQCRETFSPRPVLRKNNILDEVVRKLKEGIPEPVSPPQSCITPSDIVCDFCVKTQGKATKSCLTCLASYCDTHIEPHLTVPVLQKHQLVPAMIPLPDKMCTEHSKLMEFYCCFDEQLICSACAVEEHKTHRIETVSQLKNKTKKKLLCFQSKIQAKVAERKRNMKELLQAEEKLKSCAQTSVHDCDKIFADMVSSLQNGNRKVEQQIKAQEKAAIAQAEKLKFQLKEELVELGRRDAKLQQLLSSEEMVYQLQSLSIDDDEKDFALCAGPFRTFQEITTCLSHLKETIESSLEAVQPRISAIVSYVDFSMPPPPTSREQFLQYCRPLTLDASTNYPYLHPINNNLRMRPSPSPYAAHPNRFSTFPQILCKEGLTERCYWEIEWHARTLSAAVAYRDTNRTSDESKFGNNNKSWSLECTEDRCLFRHNNKEIEVPKSCSKKIGVFLDYTAGIIRFYKVANRMVLIFEERATFTEPLYPGLGLNYEWYDVGVFAQLVKLW